MSASCSRSAARAAPPSPAHWDGGGHPQGLRGDAIPLAARIIGLAQVVEIFWGVTGPERALEMAEQRRGRWFDPELVECLKSIASPSLWSSLEATDLNSMVAAAEPAERAIEATDERLDQIATAFAWVIDAKSSFTFEHSERVSTLALAAAERIGFTPTQLTRLRRAALRSRHRQARSPERDPRQSRQAHRRGMGRRQTASGAHPPRPATGAGVP